MMFHLGDDMTPEELQDTQQELRELREEEYQDMPEPVYGPDDEDWEYGHVAARWVPEPEPREIPANREIPQYAGWSPDDWQSWLERNSEMTYLKRTQAGQ